MRIGWSKGKERGNLHKSVAKKKSYTPGCDTKKLQLFGHICRTSNSRKIKLLFFGIVDENNKVGSRGGTGAAGY